MVDINLMPEKVKGEEIGFRDFLSRNAAIAFIVSILILLLVIYGGLKIYRDIVLVGKHVKITEEIRKIDADIGGSLPLLLKVRALEDRLKSLKNDKGTGLLDRHIYFSNIFGFLESVTHPQVSFSSFSGNAETGEISLPARVSNYSVVAEQLAGLERNKDIESVKFGGISISEAGVSFSLNLKVNTEIFRKK